MSVSNVGGTAAGTTYDVAVAKKQLDQQDQQGKQALELIQAAKAPEPQPSSHVGKLINIVA